MADFIIEGVKLSIAEITRRLGYIIIDTKGNGEYNLVRRLDRDNYPRFHIYMSQQGEKCIINLHLDQKKPIYGAKGVHAHNGEYFGPVIDNEADRVRDILKRSDF